MREPELGDWVIWQRLPREAMHERVNCHKYPCDGRAESRKKKYPKNSRKNGVQLQRRGTPA